MRCIPVSFVKIRIQLALSTVKDQFLLKARIPQHACRMSLPSYIFQEKSFEGSDVKYGQCMLARLTGHAQSLAATNRTNRVTEQLNWLTVESFFMSCSISWMASLIDNLYLLDLIVLVLN